MMFRFRQGLAGLTSELPGAGGAVYQLERAARDAEQRSTASGDSSAGGQVEQAAAALITNTLLS